MPTAEYRIPQPDEFVYADHPANEVFKEAETAPIYEIDHVEYPETGGMFIHYKGLKYPKKGFPYPEAVWAVNMIKRVVVSTVRLVASPQAIPLFIGFLLTGRKKLIAKILELVDDCLDVTDAFLYTPRADTGKPFYLKTERFMTPVKELARYLMLFLKFAGIDNEDMLQKIGRVACMIFEYDSAYLSRIQDIFSEANRDALLTSPAEEVRRLYRVYASREKLSQKVALSFKRVSLLIQLALWFPKVRRALIRATENIDLTKIAFTEADRYHVMFLDGYNFFGQTLEKRHETLKGMHGGEIPKGAFRIVVK